MTGAIIITHGVLASALVEVAESIAGKFENVKTVSVKREDTTERTREILINLVKELKKGDGIVIFTDMFGGTPTNIALSLLSEGSVEVISGINLPMLLKFLSLREKPLSELAAVLKESGQKSIVIASDMLKEKK